VSPARRPFFMTFHNSRYGAPPQVVGSGRIVKVLQKGGNALSPRRKKNDGGALPEHLIAGRELGVEEREGIWDTYTSSVYWSEERGLRTHWDRRDPYSQVEKKCSLARIVTVAGISGTFLDGTSTFFLSEYHCSSFPVGQPVVFVATPRNSLPVFLTTRTNIVVGPNNLPDVELHLWAWDPDGNPTITSFEWICIVTDASGGVE
jgi:hypothetical protein